MPINYIKRITSDKYKECRRDEYYLYDRVSHDFNPKNKIRELATHNKGKAAWRSIVKTGPKHDIIIGTLCPYNGMNYLLNEKYQLVCAYGATQIRLSQQSGEAQIWMMNVNEGKYDPVMKVEEELSSYRGFAARITDALVGHKIREGKGNTTENKVIPAKEYYKRKQRTNLSIGSEDTNLDILLGNPPEKP